MSLLLSISSCDIGWLTILGWGLIPFLLGALLSYMIWSSYKRRAENLERELRTVRRQLAELKGSVRTDPAQIERLRRDVLTRDKEIRKLQSELDSLRGDTHIK